MADSDQDKTQVLQTGEGAPPPEEKFVPPPRLQNRLDAMASIITRRQEEHTQEMADHGQERQDTTATADETRDEDPPKPTEKLPAEPTVRIKVDGQEQDVPESKVKETGIRALQKEIAADARLAEASRLQKQAEELLSRAQQTQHRPEKDDQESQPSSETEPDAAQLAKAIQFGSEEEVQAAVQTILKRSAGRQQQEAIPDAVKITNMVTEQIEFKKAVDQFSTDYSDIWNDPNLKQLALQKDAAYVQAVTEGKREPKPYSERFKEVGNEVRAWRDSLKGDKPTIPANSDKQQRKAQVTNIPSAGARASASTAPEAPKDARTIVAEMRKARGQA